MSTYLVAFVVCDYQHIRAVTKRGVSVAVYAPSDLLSQAQFALDTATKMMDYYESYFGIEYPLPKQGIYKLPSNLSFYVCFLRTITILAYRLRNCKGYENGSISDDLSRSKRTRIARQTLSGGWLNISFILD